MATVHAPHRPSPNHLAEVIEEMRTLGAPRIRAWWNGDAWIALEGSHRLAAAHTLGLTPKIEAMDEDDEIEHDFHDIDGDRVEEVIAYLTSYELGPDYRFDGLARGNGSP